MTTSKNDCDDYEFSSRADKAIVDRADPKFVEQFRQQSLGSYWLIEFRKIVNFIMRRAGDEAAERFIDSELDSRGSRRE